MSASKERPAKRLNGYLANAGLEPLDVDVALRFESYLSLILRWNSRMSLTAVRDEEGILTRHFVECIAGARILPAGINTLLDLGSGAGFPGIPIAICRPEISVTLAESQGKKAAFLKEVVRVLDLTAQVHAGRAEDLTSSFDCVVLRAVDRMTKAVQVAADLVATKGWLALFSTHQDIAGLRQAAGGGFCWGEAVRLPGGESRILVLGQMN